MDYEKAWGCIYEIITSKKNVLESVVHFLYSTFSAYSWVGIYLVDGDELVLGPWKGQQATEHIRIPIGMGVCGAAAKTGKTEVVEDVKKDSRYLACFLSTRSEIVVPIWKNNSVVGEIDIDSDRLDAFIDEDKEFLERIAQHLGDFI
ncbi:MAG: GAF domain-containing protein [Candidatus Thermoplasmatota archaeon]|nr:GAF domain-containing protein [Candidatus Thermoplasmatota archaeon]MBU1942016.1 GAF domain-containing protein [Candidatus Thermoplasmatota archaeon]